MKKLKKQKHNCIVLIGFMATGKSVIGMQLAKTLNLPYVDTDRLIEGETGENIPTLFKKHGEAYFRKLEKKIIKGLADGNKRVISTGGGAVLDPENMDLLRSLGVIIHLSSPASTILSRTKNDPNIRPLLSGDNPLEQIRLLQQERLPIYQQADYEIDTSIYSVDETVKMIMMWLNNKTQVIRVALKKDPYDIVIGYNILDQLGTMMQAFDLTERALVVTHPSIANIYETRLLKSLKSAGFEPTVVEIPEGEERKSLYWAEKLYDSMLSHRMDRRSPAIAFGGGVVGDLTGFAAATFLRGIPFIQVPTSLLAQVDASVGGKVAVDHRFGKNLIGAFYQPLFVLISLDTLESLPEKELRSGLAEVVKYGVIADADLFSYIENHRDDILQRASIPMKHLVARSCEIKAEIVSNDEKELGRRAILNFGHTMGHAIETQTGMLHGEAVAIGMVYAAQLAVRIGILDNTSVKRLGDLLKDLGLPDSCEDLDVSATIETMKYDKKSVGGQLRFILPNRIGSVVIRDDVSTNHIKSVLIDGLER